MAYESVSEFHFVLSQLDVRPVYVRVSRNRGFRPEWTCGQCTVILAVYRCISSVFVCSQAPVRIRSPDVFLAVSELRMAIIDVSCHY